MFTTCNAHKDSCPTYGVATSSRQKAGKTIALPLALGIYLIRQAINGLGAMGSAQL